MTTMRAKLQVSNVVKHANGDETLIFHASRQCVVPGFP